MHERANRWLEVFLWIGYIVYLVVLFTISGYTSQVSFLLFVAECTFGFLLGLFLYQTHTNDFKWKIYLARIVATLALILIVAPLLVHVYFPEHFPDAARETRFCKRFTDHFAQHYWAQFRAPQIGWNEFGRMMFFIEDE